MMQINSQQIADMEPRYRARFVNSLSGFKSANLIGSCDQQGRENLAIVSSVFHLGANPPLMGFIIRPSRVERHSLENIIATGCYTINAVSSAIFHQAHQTSARYKRSESEFEKVHLTPEYLDNFPAPFVQESPLKLALRLVEQQTLAINGTELVIGEIENVQLSADIIMPDGYVDIESLQLAALSGLDSYHITQRLQRLSYAKPELRVRPLSLEGEWLSLEDE